jgi:hypothetical protein
MLKGVQKKQNSAISQRCLRTFSKGASVNFRICFTPFFSRGLSEFLIVAYAYLRDSTKFAKSGGIRRNPWEPYNPIFLPTILVWLAWEKYCLASEHCATNLDKTFTA